MSRLVLVGLVVFLLLAAGFAFFSNKEEVARPILTTTDRPQTTSTDSPTPIVDRQATFAIFTNGTFRIFTASMYHNLSEDVYTESANPNTVQVKKAGVTWDDFFATLPFTVTADCLITGTNETYCTGDGGELTFYINGEKSNSALDQEINEGDHLVITFGTETEDEIRQQLNRIP